MQKITKTAYTNRPNGDNGSEIVDKLNRNVRNASASMHIRGLVSVAYCGDSMNDYGMANGYASFLGQMLMYFYDADLHISDGKYYNNDTNAAWPGGPQGQNFAKGGTTIDHMLNVQMPFIRESFAAGTLADIVFVSTFQNNRYYSGESVEGDCLKVIGALEEIVYKMGRHVVLIGPWPQNSLAASASSKHQIDAYMKNWAAGVPGVIYVSILDALKSADPAREAQDYCDYLGYSIPAGQPGHASWPNDGIHAAPLGAYKAGQLLGAQLPALIRRATLPTFTAADFNKATNTWGGVFGAMGRLIGTGGTIVNCAGSNSANWTRTASNALPAGVELVYDQSKGITLTPELTGNPDEPLMLTATGTPTADFTAVLRFSKQVDVPDQPMHVRGYGRWINQQGWAGIAVGPAGEGAPGLPSGSLISYFPGHGGVGGADYVLPFAMNNRINFHGRTFYYNFGNRKLLMDLSIGFANGIAPTGKLAISRLDMFRTSVPA